MNAVPKGFVREALFNGNGIARRLIIALVVFSSVVTTLLTAFELLMAYRQDLGRIDRSLDFIGRSYLPALTESVWVADRLQVQTQIDGLLRMPDIEYIAIDVGGRTRWSAGQAVSRRTVVLEAPLLREHLGRPTNIGTLRVVASVDEVLARLWRQVLMLLVSNGIKTVLVAGFMLLVFQWLVTRHLVKLGAFVRSIDPAQPRGQTLQLDRPASGRWRPDVLDAVTGAVNNLSRALHDAHAAAGRADARLRALLGQTTAYICEVDREGHMSVITRSEGISEGRGRGLRLADWVADESRAHVEQALADALQGRAVRRLEVRVLGSAGRVYHYVASLMPLERDGRIEQVALTAVDISENKAAEQAIRELNASLERRVLERTAELQQAVERAERASRAKGDFLSRMSHELRTPMNAVLGFAQIIEMSDPTPRQRQWAGQIIVAGQHLLQMIDDLLDLTRIEAGRIVIRVERVDPVPLIDETLALMQPSIDASGLRVVREDPLAPPVQADRLRLRQVLVNLLSNAIKYNRPGGEIRLRVERHGERVRLVVDDTGIGIAADRMPRLFQPFERLGAESGPVEGTGIGLALSRQLAALMDATMGATSRPGEGSTFWIELPLARSATAAPAPSEPLPAPALQGADVLYIEDKASNIDVVMQVLGGHGVRLRAARSGLEGLRAARDRRPDLVLLDLHLPDVDGFEVLRRLRADPTLAAVPVIALTADAMPDDVHRGQAAGFDRYLTKPFVVAELLRTVADCLPSAGRPGPRPPGES